MAFSIVEWLLSESLNFAKSKILSFVELESLNNRLDWEIDNWAKELPQKYQLVSVAMYLGINSKGPYLEQIGQKIDNQELPNEQLLFNALYERWENCRSKSNLQPFFSMSREDATVHLTKLAKRLNIILIQEEILFKRFIQMHLSEIKNDTDDIKAQLAKLEYLIRNGEFKVSQLNNVYRPLPKCHVLIHTDPAIQKYLTLSFFKIALFENFRSVKYKKFTCLFIFSEDLFENENGLSNPGLSLISGEVTFLGSCQKLVDLFCNNHNRFIEILEFYNNNDEYNAFNLNLKFFQTAGVIPFSIEIDGQNKTYRVNPILFKGIDYDNLSSLNAILPFLASMTEPRIQAIDLDKLSKSPAALKVVYKAINDNTIDFAPIKVNVDNFDDWDYEYNVQSY